MSAPWRELFLSTLAETGVVSTAAAVSGVARVTVYAHRNSDAEFASQWESAIEEANDKLESEAIRRGTRGVKKPVYQGGKRVGYIREYSDTLLIFLLKCRRYHGADQQTPVNLSTSDLSRALAESEEARNAADRLLAEVAKRNPGRAGSSR